MIARIDQDGTLPIDQVVHGECLSVMRSFPDNSVDSIVCDPPAGINFMCRDFDSNRGGRDKWILWLSTIMKEALRVLRPGGHCLVWSLPRTSHWTGLALEQAGFEMRDCLYHTQAQDGAMAAFDASLTETQRDALARLIDSQEAPSSILALFGSGFPKSLDISKAIDKVAGVEREVIGESVWSQRFKCGISTTNSNNGWKRPGHYDGEGQRVITAPATDDAKRFAGYGSALKPACESWWLCRKPLSEKTLAANCLKWGTGGLNIDKSRVGTSGYTQEQWDAKGMARTTGNTYGEHVGSSTPVPSKRFPSHVLFSHSLFCTDDVCDASCPVRVLEQQSGVRKSGNGTIHRAVTLHDTSDGWGMRHNENAGTRRGDTGTASRFFHCFTPDVPFLYASKASRSERSKGCEGLDDMKSSQNTHPCVKSLSLMKYLCNLICPPDGIVLDMFFGSGSTGVAALQSGLHFVGIEQELEYVAIARARIAHAMRGEE